MRFASPFKMSFKALLAAAVFGVGALALAAPTEARVGGFGGFHGGGGGGFHGGFGGFHGGFGGGFNPGFRGGFHPAFAGRPFMGNRAFFARHPFFFHRRRFFNNNAFVVGLASGAALGGLYDYPYYGYPYYSTYGEDCYYVRRRVVNPWGHVVWRRSLVCGY